MREKRERKREGDRERKTETHRKSERGRVPAAAPGEGEERGALRVVHRAHHIPKVHCRGCKLTQPRISVTRVGGGDCVLGGVVGASRPPRSKSTLPWRKVDTAENLNHKGQGGVGGQS